MCRIARHMARSAPHIHFSGLILQDLPIKDDAMTWCLFRSLVVTCSLLQALPPGWCCCLGRADCCRAAHASEETPGKPGCCCCCQEEAASESPQPAQDAPPRRPAQTCCCQREPTTSPRITVLDVDPAAVAFFTPADLLPAPKGRGEQRGVGFFVPSPPLRVLQCVWLC